MGIVEIHLQTERKEINDLKKQIKSLHLNYVKIYKILSLLQTQVQMLVCNKYYDDSEYSSDDNSYDDSSDSESEEE